MKILLHVFPVALISLFFFSCQKEVHGDIPQDVNPATQNDSILLSKYIELDTTLPSGADTMFQIRYTYDNEKRLKRYYLTDYADEETVDFYYSGSDTLPYKTVDFWTNYGDVYRDTIFYSYINGLVSKDSIIEYNNSANQFFYTEVRSFTPVGSNTFLQHRHYSSPGQSLPDDEAKGTVYKTYQNGNIVVQDDSTSLSIGFAYSAHQEVKYDNKVNPFYKALPVRYPILYYWLIAQKNNPLENISWDDVSYPGHLLYSYTYRQDGYPISVKITDQVNADGWKASFFYTK